MKAKIPLYYLFLLRARVRRLAAGPWNPYDFALGPPSKRGHGIDVGSSAGPGPMEKEPLFAVAPIILT